MHMHVRVLMHVYTFLNIIPFQPNNSYIWAISLSANRSFSDKGNRCCTSKDGTNQQLSRAEWQQEPVMSHENPHAFFITKWGICRCTHAGETSTHPCHRSLSNRLSLPATLRLPDLVAVISSNWVIIKSETVVPSHFCSIKSPKHPCNAITRTKFKSMNSLSCCIVFQLQGQTKKAHQHPQLFHRAPATKYPDKKIITNSISYYA
jgi:hypothetical protein